MAVVGTRPLAERVVAELRRRGETLAVAESLTGGALASAVVDVPGASTVLRGGVVAYATEVKHSVLGVDGSLLDRVGPVDAEVARQMACGVRERLGGHGGAASWGLATTGVAGPDPQGGHPPGTVWLGLASALGARAVLLSLAGDRATIRSRAVSEALSMLLDELADPRLGEGE